MNVHNVIKLSGRSPFTVLFIFSLTFFYFTASVQGESSSVIRDSIKGHIERLESRYHIPFKYTDFPGPRKFLNFREVSSAADYRVLNDYLSLFEQEINKYPQGFFKKQDIRGIGLVMNLFGGERAAEGLYHAKARIMFFDISRFADNKARQRHSIHHEIFHMMAFKNPDSSLLKDDHWRGLNHPGFSYGLQTKSLRDPNPYNTSAPNQLGFATYYSMEAQAEDQAEIFACLMQKSHRRLLEQWQKKDPYLKKKIQAIKDFVANYDPEMDAEYWN